LLRTRIQHGKLDSIRSGLALFPRCRGTKQIAITMKPPILTSAKSRV